jgi:hypothetical protein
VVGASRAATKAGARLGRLVPDWTPNKLGVHATIVVDGVTGLTPYVLRDHDAKLREVLAQMRQPAARARLVTVVGTSCSGKTRTLYEAVNQVFPDWTLVRLDDIDSLTRVLYDGIPGHTVVWLDELQKFLTNESNEGVRAARGIRQLLNHPDSPPIAFAATIWPTNLEELKKRPDPAGARVGLEEISSLLRHPAAYRVDVPDVFTEDELGPVSRADPRMAKAIQYAADGQVTQVLAGGTQLVHRVYSDQAHIGQVFSPAARAVILGAADLRRIGYPNPVPRWAIAGAAHDYLEPAERRWLNPATWIQDALDEAAQDAIRHHQHQYDIQQGGVPALTRFWLDHTTGPAAESEHYELHDYLLQHHLNAYRHSPTTATLWSVLTAPSNLPRLTEQIAVALGWNALRRGLYSEAIPLLTIAADGGHRRAQEELVDLLVSRGDEEGLRIRAYGGSRAYGDDDLVAQAALAQLLADREDEEGFRDLAHASDEIDGSRYLYMSTLEMIARGRLVELLKKRGDEDGLRVLADRGDHSAEDTLYRLEAMRSDEKDLRARAGNGDWRAHDSLIEALQTRGDEEGLRTLAASGDKDAANTLTSLLSKRGNEEALHSLARDGNSLARFELARLQAERGDLTKLRALADGGGRLVANMLADLTDRGDERRLRARAASGDQRAEVQISNLLAERGDEQGLSVLAEGGNPDAQARLARLLAGRGAVNELRDLVHATYWGAAEALIKLYKSDQPYSYVELDVKAEPRLITRPKAR